MWIDDQILCDHQKKMAIKIFAPSTTVVVLGSSNDENTEVNKASCAIQKIEVTRRYGGGGTVVLYPGCVVASVGTWVNEPYKNDLFFKLLNQAVIDALGAEWPKFKNLSQSGISDIVFEQKKIAGTSLFRSRNYLLYQASILVDLNIDLVESCLLHPTKEPDYRKGRRHADFLTGLSTLQEGCTPKKVEDVLQKSFEGQINHHLKEYLIVPQEPQMKSLEDRLERAKLT